MSVFGVKRNRQSENFFETNPKFGIQVFRWDLSHYLIGKIFHYIIIFKLPK